MWRMNELARGMTTAIRRRWPVYALLGTGAVLALRHACARRRIRKKAGDHLLRSLWWKVDGLPMHARVANDAPRPAAPPVVLVHGLGVSGAYFVPAAQLLAADFAVYVPDLPGHGLSATPAAPPDIAGLARALIAWMDGADIGRASLVGHSMGCQIVVEAALRHPERIARLVLIAPVTDPAARSIPQQLGHLVESSIFERLALVPQVIKDYLRVGTRIIPELRSTLSYPIETKLPEVRAPVMLIRGERDSIAPQAWVDEAARLLRAPVHVIPRWSHAVHYSAPAEVVAAMRPFLAHGNLGTAPPASPG
jgi:pimeloyl-ACP methyl ester carboxylesterase